MLEIKHLEKHYKDFHLDCTMNVQSGRVTGLIGQNGAGKTTTLKAALGLVRPDGGQISLFGKPLESCGVEEKQRVGVALSDSGFSAYLSIREIVPIMRAMYTDFDREDFLEKCRRFGLPLNKKLKEFSTGMKAKLKVLVALSHGAQFLILDEPTTGLDVAVRDDILTMFRKFMEEDDSRAILISSHISSDLESLCDDFYMMQDGRVVLHEETGVLLGEYALLKLDEAQYGAIDKQYILRRRKEPYGYLCLTNQRRFYLENCPGAVVEKSGLDELILMMIRGEAV
ncbi:MAG: ABC transporter ATP-binding protein [Butyrivibrio sp.]|nr:ABC transporter ATP-binding protein [Muribaculum sp.]MCM1551638.1 ABC transporter ATP-binding protein [Butyrivibrio sp.]